MNVRAGVDEAQDRHHLFSNHLLLNEMARLSVLAGGAIMQARAIGPRVRRKPDDSPVCDADEAAELIIVAGLQEHFAHVPVVAEEAASRGCAAIAGGVDSPRTDGLPGGRRGLPAEVGGFELRIGAEFFALAGHHDAAGLEDVRLLADFEGEVGVLFDE